MSNDLIVTNKSALDSEKKEYKMRIHNSSTFPSGNTNKIQANSSYKKSVSNAIKNDFNNCPSKHSTVLLHRSSARPPLGIKASNLPVVNRNKLNNNNQFINYVYNRANDTQMELLMEDSIPSNSRVLGIDLNYKIENIKCY